MNWNDPKLIGKLLGYGARAPGSADRAQAAPSDAAVPEKGSPITFGRGVTEEEYNEFNLRHLEPIPPEDY